MSERRCKNCKFWKDDELEHMGRLYPICESQAFVDDFYFIGTTIAPKSIFWCRHWEEKPEDDVRERVAQHLFRSWAKKWKSLVGYEAAYEYISDGFRNEFFADADKLLAIVRGEGK